MAKIIKCLQGSERKEKEAVLFAFRRWHKKHPDCLAAFVRASDLRTVTGGEFDLMTGFMTYSFEGVTVLALSDNALPVRFMEVFPEYALLVRQLHNVRALVRGMKLLGFIESGVKDG